MLAIITKLDGTNALLFHVEQWTGGAWEYRLSLPDGTWAEPEKAQAELAYAAPTSLEHPVTAQWRSGERDWQDAAPHEFGPATCRFTIEIQPGHSYRSGDELRVCASVRGQPSGWLLEMPLRKWDIQSPEVIEVTGRSESFGPGQILRHPGEFMTAGRGMAVVNAEPSQATLLPVPAATPSVMPRQGIFMVATGRLSEEEIEHLKQLTTPSTPPWQE